MLWESLSFLKKTKSLLINLLSH